MPELLPLGPRQQLSAGRLTRRMVQLFVGLILFGVSMGTRGFRFVSGLASAPSPTRW
jgi:hypothetical protein